MTDTETMHPAVTAQFGLTPLIHSRRAGARTYSRAVACATATTLCAALSLSHADQPVTADQYLISDLLLQRTDEGLEDGRSHVRTYGTASSPTLGTVVLIPSLGRGVEDFTERFGSSLTTRLVKRGFQVTHIQPRGIGKSTWGLQTNNASLSALANDILNALDTIGVERAHIIGHAFGNRVARSFATAHPERTIDVTLLAAGGQHALSHDQGETLWSVFSSKHKDDRLQAISKGFFAPGNDASVWLEGWYADAASAQRESALRPDVDFIAAGGRPMLIVQPEQDFIAPPDDAGRFLKTALGEQATYVEIPNSGHALLPEQPEPVIAAVIDFLTRSYSEHKPAQPSDATTVCATQR